MAVYQCALLSDSSLESDCNTSDVSDTVVNEGINNKEDIEGISEKSDRTSDARIDEFGKHMHIHNFSVALILQSLIMCHHQP